MKKLAVALLAATLCISQVFTSLAGTWKQESGAWYLDNNGTNATGWQQDNGKWYHMDQTGKMQVGFINDGVTYHMADSGAMDTGWKTIAGSWYFFNPQAKSVSVPYIQGQMLTGWQWIDGKCYYMDQTGKMAHDTTIEGYTVGADGAWIQNGTVVYTAGKGIPSTTKIASTTTPKASAPGGSGGGGGGGGSSSGGSHSSGGGSSSGGSSSGVTTKPTQYGDFNTLTGTTNTEESKKAAADAVVASVIPTIITPTMTEFEKEMAIAKYIVANTRYQTGNVPDEQNKYGALVNKVASCGGIADAFLSMAKAAGLDCRVQITLRHAWNLVKIDGQWYTIDLSDSCSGGSILANEINRTALTTNNIDGRTMSPIFEDSFCTGTVYNPEVVKNYLDTGIVDTSLDQGSLMTKRLAACDYVLDMDSATYLTDLQATFNDIFVTRKALHASIGLKKKGTDTYMGNIEMYEAYQPHFNDYGASNPDKIIGSSGTGLDDTYYNGNGMLYMIHTFDVTYAPFYREKSAPISPEGASFETIEEEAKTEVIAEDPIIEEIVIASSSDAEEIE